MGIGIIVRLIVLMLAAFATGGLMVNWIGLARAMARLSSASGYTALHQATNQTFDPYMPIVVVGALLGGLVLVAVSPGIHTASGQFALAGVFCYAAVMAIGLPTCVRINKLVEDWSVQAPPDNWTAVRARWVKFHILRTLFSVPALASYIVSILLSSSR
jgi:uncharacterized membrane protein